MLRFLQDSFDIYLIDSGHWSLPRLSNVDRFFSELKNALKLPKPTSDRSIETGGFMSINMATSYRCNSGETWKINHPNCSHTEFVLYEFSMAKSLNVHCILLIHISLARILGFSSSILTPLWRFFAYLLVLQEKVAPFSILRDSFKILERFYAWYLAFFLSIPWLHLYTSDWDSLE